jgi:RNA polymerase sigma factor (sigma-70 family)
VATAHPDTVLQHIRRLVAAEQTHRQTDAQLLKQFTLHQDQAAFAALVRRHGPLVLGVCRRILHNGHDAEDALQATCLVLARKARSIARPESVGSWLYQVAYRVAIRARARAASRQQHERQADRQPLADPLAEVTGRELLALLDEELHQLPPCHRAPLVLCYLEGRTRDQAARQLGWSLRRLKHRLEQGRERLRARLAQRGVALPAILLAAGLGEGAAQAALPARLVNATIEIALSGGSGTIGAVGVATAPVSALAESVLQTMTVPRLKTAAVLLFAVSAAIVGAAVFLHQAPGKRGAGTDARNDGAKTPTRPNSAPTSKPSKEGRQGITDKLPVTGRVLHSSGKPLAGAETALIGLPRDASRQGLWLLDKKLLARVKTDAAGRFRLVVARKALATYERVYVLAGAAGHGLVWQEVPPGAERPEVVVRLPEEKIIRGRLRDLQGQPAVGVLVRVAWLGNGGSAEATEMRLGDLPKGSLLWPAPAITDKDGKFVLRSLNPALHGYIFIESDKFAPHYVAIKADAGKKLQEVNAGLAPAQLIEGVVTAADTGKPLAGARVSVNSDQNPDAPEAMGIGVDGRADAHGRFRLNPPSGKLFTVRAAVAADEPYLEVHKTFKWPRGAIRRQVNLVLARAVLIRGKVTELDSGKPVAGALVRDTKGLWTNPTATTRADGSFQIAVAPGQGHLLVKGPGNDYIPLEMTWAELDGAKPHGRRFYPDALVPFELKAGAAVKEVAVRLRRGVTIRGRLLGTGGKPPREALLLCWNQVRQHVPEWFSAAVHVSDGRFELRGCDPTRTYTVYFLDPLNKQGATVHLSAKKANGKPVTVPLAPCGSAEGRFLDKEGKPRLDFRPHFFFYIVVRPGSQDARKGPSADSDFVANVDRVHYSGVGGTMDNKGRCRFVALIPGATYRILDYNFKLVKDFTVKPGQKLQLPDLVITR